MTVERIASGGERSGEKISGAHVVVELGCGHNPLPMLGPRGQFTGNNYYIGIDLPRLEQEGLYSFMGGPPNDGVLDGMAWVKRLVPPGEQAHYAFLEGDMNDTVLPEDIADEVLLCNVLNDPVLQRREGESKFRDLFAEVRRIMKPGGRLVIATTTSELDGVREIIEANGFTIREDDRGAEIVRGYRSEPDSFFNFLTADPPEVLAEKEVAVEMPRGQAKRGDAVLQPGPASDINLIENEGREPVVREIVEDSIAGEEAARADQSTQGQPRKGKAR